MAVFILASALIFTWQLCTRSNLLSSFIHSKKTGTIVDHPIHKVDYGVQNTPVVMIRASLDDQLLDRFLEEHLYSCPEEELHDFPGLDNRVKKPVYVYEGYYHSLPTSETVYSKNPNPFIGSDFDKPSASPFTRAFYDAFRVANKEIFDRLKQNLLLASSFNNNTMQEEDACYILATWIDKGYHFGDLSIQIHYGQGNEDKLTSGRAWHTDAENSLLHLAVTLRGRRVLHSKRMQTNANNSTLRRPTRIQEPMKEVLEEQEPGDVYLSSSTLMRHAPQFFDTGYSTRVIAIHARFLYTSMNVDHFRRVRTKASWDVLTNVLATTLAVANLQIPSLAQVESRLLLLPNH
ncbi:hypothetical protein ACHAXR_005665 [Thalassiosira sp. AJA248-18]